MKRAPGMALLPLLLMVGCELPPSVPAPALQQGAQEQDPLEDLYRLERLPRLRPGQGFRMFSSYDRTGGNDDGFSGAYSRLRVEDGDSVLAEVQGPGVIRRIYFAPSDWWRQDVLDGKGERIRVYLDGEPRPALDLPLADLFSGQHPRFPRPLVGGGAGGFYCYVPIPFAHGCKVVVEGQGVRFYQIGVQTLSPGAVGDMRAFSMDGGAALAATVRAWQEPGRLPGEVEARLTGTRVDLDLAPGASVEVALPSGAHMVRAVRYLPPADTTAREAARQAWVELSWDGADTPAVRVPLGFLLGQVFSPGPYASLITGQRGGVAYNLLPMPYHRSARLRLRAEERVSGGGLTVFTAPLEQAAARDMAYLHAAYSDQRPTSVGERFPWLIHRGVGHYVGTYLVTAGWKWLPYWMEGDERFMVDGRQVAHGTGHEEYFNTGWYMAPGQLDRPTAAPLSGVPVMGLAPSGFRMTGYRWHLAAPVPYQEEIRAEIEHGPYNTFPAHYRSAAFFYDVNPDHSPAVPGG